MVFPVSKVTNMARSTHTRSPRLFRLHHCLVKLYGEEHKLVLLLFLFQCSHDLVFDPGALYRVFREHDEELIVNADRFINAIPEFVTDLEILRGKPAAYLLAHQIGVETFGKGLIFRGVADEAGVVLNGIVDEGAYIDDKSFWNTCFLEKNL